MYSACSEIASRSCVDKPSRNQTQRQNAATVQLQSPARQLYGEYTGRMQRERQANAAAIEYALGSFDSQMNGVFSERSTWLLLQSAFSSYHLSSIANCSAAAHNTKQSQQAVQHTAGMVLHSAVSFLLRNSACEHP